MSNIGGWRLEVSQELGWRGTYHTPPGLTAWADKQTLICSVMQKLGIAMQMLGSKQSWASHPFVTHFLQLQGGDFQTSFGSYVKDDTTQRLRAHLKAGVSSSELEHCYSPPWGQHCFTSHKQFVIWWSSNTKAPTFSAQTGSIPLPKTQAQGLECKF